MMKKICHIIYDDKFTPGYVDFFISNIPEVEHYFVIFGGKYERRYSKNDYSNYNNIIKINSIFKIVEMFKAIRTAFKSDKVIISGFFGIDKLIFFFPDKFWKKTYIHLWGGDYYPYTKIKKSISKSIFKRCLVHSKGLITNAYENQIISKAFNISKEYYDLNMPSYTKDMSYIENEMPKQVRHSFTRILVGNSSTKTNNHIEVFKLISNYKNENIQIVCPLSYGDFTYRDYVIEKGKEIFGNKFIPLTKTTNKYNYINILNNCDIAIFYHERQQAVGNIQFLFKLKKKIYLNSKSPLWNLYKDSGYNVYTLNNSNTIDFLSFSKVNEVELDANRSLILTQETKYTNDWVSFIKK